MKFGWCTDIQNIALAEKLGFDYLEGIAAAVAAMDEGEFSQALSLVSGSAISPEAFCVMFGGGIKLTGDDARAGDIDEYCARLFSRLARLGGKTAVFGSGSVLSMRSIMVSPFSVRSRRAFPGNSTPMNLLIRPRRL